MIIEKDKDITGLTTFGIQVKTKYFAEYSSVKELEEIIKTDEYRENQVFHIGGGSNLLFLGDYDGLVIHSAIKGITGYKKNEETTFLIAGAGEKWNDVVEWAIENNLGGIENLIGIPGETGAAAVQNIGAYGMEISDILHHLECYDLRENKIKIITREECEYGYRESIFKNKERGRYVILRVSLRLKNDKYARCLSYSGLNNLQEKNKDGVTIKDVAAEIIRLRNEKLPDPKKLGNAGSYFKNPVVHRYFYEEVIKSFENGVPYYETNDKDYVKLSAAWLIEKSGLKGFSIGKAAVYDKQCLVIVNQGGATYSEILRLADQIKERVSQKFGIWLHEEVNYIDSTMKITILGSGTSKGVPEIGCRCRTCLSTDEKDKRLRCSTLVETNGCKLLIDVSPDFRQQFLKLAYKEPDAALITHSHYDHVGGIDDLRPFCAGGKLPLYVKADVRDDLMRRLDYCFAKHLYPGVPTFELNVVGDKPFYVKGVKVIPITVMHGKKEILGYRINDFAYITDAKTIPSDEEDKLSGLKVLVVNALRERTHFAHFSLKEALELIARLKPERAYLTHFNHEIGLHAELENSLPYNVYPCYDGLEITIK